MSESGTSLFGMLAVELGLITEDQLNECLRIQIKTRKAGKNALRIGQLLEKKGYMQESDIQRILDDLGKGGGKLFGELACYYRFSSPQQLQECLVQQQEERRAGRDRKLGEIMVERSMLNARQVETLLAVQNRRQTAGPAPETDKATSAPAPAASKIKPGAKVGHFLIERQLGQNSLGLVFQAKDGKHKRAVTLQLLNADICHDKDRLDRIKDNLRQMQQMDNPHIRKAYSIETVGPDCSFIVLQFVNGQSLWSIVEKKGKIFWEDAVKVLLQAADGLYDAGKLGLLHGDVRPSNFLLDEKMNLVINGLGLESHMKVDLLATASEPVPTYQAPEDTMGGGAVDHRADIFSLGLLLYYMVTGEHFLQGKNALEPLFKLSKGDIKPIRESIPSAPEKLDRIFLKMCHPERDERYPRYADLTAALHSLLEKDSKLAPGSSVLSSVGLDPVEAEAIRRVWHDTERQEKTKDKKTGIPPLWIAGGVAGVLILGVLLKTLVFPGGGDIEVETPMQAIVEPDGKYETKINFYSDMAANDPDPRRKAVASKRLRALTDEMNAAAELSFESLRTEVDTLQKSLAFQHALDRTLSFDLDSFYTDEWKQSRDTLAEEIVQNARASKAAMEAAFQERFDAGDWDGARTALTPYEITDYTDLKETMTALREKNDQARAADNARQETDRIRRSAEALNAARAEILDLLKECDFLGANKHATLLLGKLAGVLTPQDADILRAEGERIKGCWTDLGNLGSLPSFAATGPEVWIRMKDGYGRIAGVDRDGFKVLNSKDQPEPYEWKTFPVAERYYALSEILMASEDTDCLKRFASFFLDMEAPVPAARIGFRLKELNALPPDMEANLRDAGKRYLQALDPKETSTWLRRLLDMMRRGGREMLYPVDAEHSFDAAMDQMLAATPESRFKGERTDKHFADPIELNDWKVSFGQAVVRDGRIETEGSTNLAWKGGEKLHAARILFQFPDKYGELEMRLGDVVTTFKIEPGQSARLSTRVGMDLSHTQVPCRRPDWHALAVQNESGTIRVLLDGDVVLEKKADVALGELHIATLGKAATRIDFVSVWK